MGRLTAASRPSHTEGRGCLLQFLVDEGSQRTPTPMLLQQFMEHHGLVFKVYVLGGSVSMAVRPSIRLSGPLCLRHPPSGIVSLPRVSCNPMRVLAAPAADAPPPPLTGSAPPAPTDVPGASGPTAAQHGRPPAPNGASGRPAPQIDRPRSCPIAVVGGGAPQPALSVFRRDSSLRAEKSLPKLSMDANGLLVKSWTGLDGHGNDVDVVVPNALPTEGAFHPPAWLPEAVGKVLRERLGLTLFNIDMICPAQLSAGSADANPTRRTYQVIDINYFPGFDKLDNFEDRWVQFLHQQCVLSRQSVASGGVEGGVPVSAER